MKRGRPLEFDPDLALKKAMEVFWCRGYEATSLPDLLAAMEISKSSFYQAFGSKQKVFERCLQLFRERQVTRMTHALQRSRSGKAFLRSMLLAAAREAEAPTAPKGCLIMNTATEFSGRDSAISGLVGDGTRQFTEVFSLAIKRAQSEGEIDCNQDSEMLARYVVTTMSGLKTMVKAGMSAEAIAEVVEVAMTALI